MKKDNELMTEPHLPTIKSYDANHPNPCADCSNCCEYLALEIDEPTTMKDFDNILWYLLHEHVWVYVDHDNSWNIQFNTKCEKLDKSGQCGYYANRPILCREYHPKECPRHDSEPTEDLLLKNKDDLFSYLSKRRPATYKKMLEKIQKAN